MIRDASSKFFRRLGLRVSKSLERRLTVWPRRRLQWVLILLAALGVAWCGWTLGSSLFKIFNHH
jgi:hypothetical protein